MRFVLLGEQLHAPGARTGYLGCSWTMALGPSTRISMNWRWRKSAWRSPTQMTEQCRATGLYEALESRGAEALAEIPQRQRRGTVRR